MSDRNEPLSVSLAELVDAARHVVDEWRIRGDHGIDTDSERRLTAAVENYDNG
jgi:hypothetical protein